MKSQKKVYTTPRLTKHGSLVQLTAEYIPGMGHVVIPDPDAPPPISAPAIPGNQNGNTPPSDNLSGVAPPSSGTPPANDPSGGQGGGGQGRQGGGGQGGGGNLSDGGQDGGGQGGGGNGRSRGARK